ncbi:hypothetical protein AB205_0075360, partial [Aquarana catesbeiana]
MDNSVDQQAILDLCELWNINEDDDLVAWSQYSQPTVPIQHTSFRPKSVFNPTQSKGPFLTTFYEVVYKDLLDYLQETYRLLSDTKTYEKLKTDPLAKFIEESKTPVTLALGQGILTKLEASFFLKPFFQVPYLYHLPKIHKDPNKPPGRPIVASMNSITTSYSLYIDQFLQPLAQSLPSYINDGTHLIDLLHPYRWESSYLWVSLDVCLLYTSIPHEIGLQAISYYLHSNPLLNPSQI